MRRDYIGGLLVLAFSCVLASCGSESAGTPSFVARTWSLQIGGAGDAQPDDTRGTPIDFGGSEVVDVPSGPSVYTLEWPLVVEGEARFLLPPPPQTPEELQQRGLRLVGVTHCAFLNESGLPSERDVRAVDEAVSSFVSALEQPLREASPNDAGISDATEVAAETLFKEVLRQLNIPESREGLLDAQANQGLWFIGDLTWLLSSTSAFGLDSDLIRLLKNLIRVVPSLVWVHGDASTRSTLSACGTLVLFDASSPGLRSEIRLQFEGECTDLSGGSVDLCSLETYERNRPRQVLRSPELRGAPFASWEIEPTIQYNRMSCVGRPKEHQNSVPEGACITPESMLMYGNLQYVNDYEQTYCGAEAVAAIAQDCMIGAEPRCGTETGLVLSDGNAEHREILANCVNRCTSSEIQRLVGSDDRDPECRSCYGNYAACVAASCAEECAGEGSFCCDEMCREQFSQCAGSVYWPPGLPFF